MSDNRKDCISNYYKQEYKPAGHSFKNYLVTPMINGEPKLDDHYFCKNWVEVLACLDKLYPEDRRKSESIEEQLLEQKNKRADDFLRTKMPAGFSSGYIGNCSSGANPVDDRSWFIFRDHPGRVGTSADSLGGFPTAERYKLMGILSTIIWTLNSKEER